MNASMIRTSATRCGRTSSARWLLLRFQLVELPGQRVERQLGFRRVAYSAVREARPGAPRAGRRIFCYVACVRALVSLLLLACGAKFSFAQEFEAREFKTRAAGHERAGGHAGHGHHHNNKHKPPPAPTPASATLANLKPGDPNYTRSASNTSGTADQWSAGTNWDATPTSGTNTQLVFGGAGPTALAAGATIFTNNNIAGNFQLNIFDFTYSGPASGVQPTVTVSGNPLQFVSNGATTPTMNLNGTGTVKPLLTVSNNIVLTNNLSITGSSDGILSGVISGAGNLTKTGTGVTTFSNTGSTYTGQLTVQAGTLKIDTANNVSSNGELGNSAGAVILGASGTTGTLEYTGATAASSKPFTMATSGTGAFQIDTAGTTLTLSGAIGGSGALTKTGAGTLSLSSGSNSYSGGTTVSAGTLQLSGSGILGSTSGSLTVNGGTLNLNGTNQTVGNLTGSGGTILNNATGTNVALTIGNGNGTGGIYSGVIANNTSGTGTVALTKTGTGTIALSGTNTYTGTTTLSGGVLRLDSASALGGGNLQFQSGVLGLGAGDFTRALGTNAGQVQWTDNNGGGFAAYGADRIVNIGGAGATITTGSGSAFWASSSDNLILGAADADHTVTFVNGIQLNSSGSTNRTIQVNDGCAAIDAIVSGVISTASGGTRGITKTGTGTLVLSGANSYDGTTTVSAGVLNIQNSTALGTTTGSTSVTSGATLQIQGVNVGAEALTLNGAGVASVSGGAIGQNGALVNVSGTNSYGGLLTLGSASTISSDSGTLNLTNTGTISGSGFALTLTGAGNGSVSSIIGTGAGTLTKTGTGTWTLSANNTYTGGTTINAGTLTLDYSTVASKLADTGVLNFGGGTLNLSGGASAHTEVVASTTLTANSSSSVTRTSGTSVLRMNAITRNAGSTVNFGAASIADTDTTNTNGILGGYATVGATTGAADWAVNSTNAGDGSIIALASGSYAAFATTGTNTNNELLTGSSTLTGNATTNSLKINTSGTGQSLNLVSGQTLTLTTGGLMFIGAQDYSITNGTLKSNTATNSDLIIQQWGAGNLTIGSVIANGNGLSTLTKAGTGTLTLGGTNTYTGATTINAGTLSVSSLAAGGSNSNIGASANAATNLILNGGTLQYTGTTVSTDRLFSVGANGGTIDASGSGTLTFSNAGAMGFNSQVGTRTVTLTGTNTGNNTLTVAIGDNSGATSLTKNGTGTWVLNNTTASTYSGATTVNLGTLSIDNNGTTTARLANTSSISVNSGGTLLLAGTSSSTDRINDRAGITLSGGGTIKTGGLSEGTRPTNSSSTNGLEGMGALTLTSTNAGSHATIDFLTGANGSSLVFCTLLGGNGAFLDIKNWSGLLGTDNSATTNDRLLFDGNPNLTNAQLTNFQFFDDSGITIGSGATIIAYGNEFELVPVPEPSTWVAAALTLGAIGWSQRRRLCSRKLSELARLIKRA